MSVTVADILKLPSLRQAKVLGGQNGLNKAVSSISVLESVNPDVLVQEVFPQDKYSGGEIVITGFLNCIDDVDLQCANLMRLIEGGEVGVAAGFKIWLSNNVPNTGGAKYKIIAGTNEAASFAEQILKTEAYRPEKRFSDAVKGLHVYGAKVFQGKCLSVLTANRK